MIFLELTVIVLALLAGIGGLVMLAGLCLHAAAAHSARCPDAARPDHRRRTRGKGRGSEGLLALSVAAGLTVIVLASVSLGKLIEDVTKRDGIAMLDHPVAHFVASRRVPALTSVMAVISTAGGPAAMALLGLAVGIILSVTRRSWMPVLVLAVTAAGVSGLAFVFKTVLGLPRPPAAQAVAHADGYGFPSGHAAAAAAVCGVAAWLIASRRRSWTGWVATWAGAAVIAGVVGISRIYLGVHWTTDVLGGWSFGVLWMGVVISGWAYFGSNGGFRPRSAAGEGEPRNGGDVWP